MSDDAPTPPPSQRPVVKRRMVVSEHSPDEASRLPDTPLIGGGEAGHAIPAVTSRTLPDAGALVAVSVWMPDDLKRRLDAAIPGVHRRSLVMVAYHRHNASMYAEPVHRPGATLSGSRSRNWTVRIRRDEHDKIQALARYLGWPISAVIRKLLEFEVTRHSE